VQLKWKKSSNMEFSLLGAYKVALIIYGIILSFKLRKIPFIVFDESKILGFHL